MLTEDDEDDIMEEKVYEGKETCAPEEILKKNSFDYSNLEISSFQENTVRFIPEQQTKQTFEEKNTDKLVENFLGIMPMESHHVCLQTKNAETEHVEESANVEEQTNEDEEYPEEEYSEDIFNEFFDDDDDQVDNESFCDNLANEHQPNENLLLVDMADTLHKQFESVENTMEDLQKKHLDALELIDFLCCSVNNIHQRTILRQKMRTEVDKSYLRLIGNSTSSLLYLLNVKSRVNEMVLLVYDMKNNYTIETKKPIKTCGQFLTPYLLISCSFFAGAISWACMM